MKILSMVSMDLIKNSIRKFTNLINVKCDQIKKFFNTLFIKNCGEIKNIQEKKNIQQEDQKEHIKINSALSMVYMLDNIELKEYVNNNFFNMYKFIKNKMSNLFQETFTSNLEFVEIQIIEDEFICDDNIFICILENINLFIEENSSQLLFYILSVILILLAKLFIIYKNQNSKNKKKMNLKEFIKFLKKYHPYLLYLFYILLLCLFFILYKKIKKYVLNIFKSMKNLAKTYKRLLRLFSKVEFLEKFQKLGFDKLNEDVDSLFDMVNHHLASQIINMKNEIDQIKKEIIDINSNIIIF